MADVEANFNGSKLDEVLSGLRVRGSFGYTVNYAKYVNYPTSYAGTSPPFKPIRKWVHRKWNDLDEGLKNAAFEEGMNQEEHKDAVAWIVVKSIAENGTEGVYFMERAVADIERQAEAFASRYANTDDPDAPFKILRDLLDGAFGISQDIVADEATDTGNLLQSGFVDIEQVDSNRTYEDSGGGK
jgi:hypothetical protein